MPKINNTEATTYAVNTAPAAADLLVGTQATTGETQLFRPFGHFTSSALGNYDRAYQQLVRDLRPANLLAYWPLDEASGTFAGDDSGIGRHGSYKGSGEPSPGNSLQGFTAPVFDGTNDYINFYSTSLRDAFNGALGTLLAWVRVDGGSRWTDSTSRRAVMLQADANNIVSIVKNSTSGQIQGTYTAGGTTGKQVIDANQFSRNWVCVAFTWNAANDIIKLYTDGVRVTGVAGQQDGLGTWAGTLGPTTTVIGNSSTVGTTAVWNGAVAHVAVWDAELSAAEIAMLAAGPRRGQLLLEGDSQTVGASPITIATNYPSVLSGTLADNWKVLNVATSGETLTQMQAEIAAQVQAQYNRAYARQVVVIFGGVNDAAAMISSPGTIDETTIYNRIVTYGQTVRALGFRVLVCTLTPASSAAVGPTYNSKSATINASIRANYASFADGIVDLRADSRLDDELDTTYYNADKLHLNVAGAAVVAELVAAAIAALD